MQRTIKYLSYFDYPDSPVRRNAVPACVGKMESVADLLLRGGYRVEILSMSSVAEPRFRFYGAQTVRRSPGLTLRLFPSFGGRGRLLAWLRVIWHVVAMFCYLLVTLRRTDTLLVYHSLGYFGMVSLLRRLRRFRLVLEVEEVYQDVAQPKYRYMARQEFRDIAAADAYLFPTTLLERQFNTRHRPALIIHGTYSVVPQRVERPAQGGTVHVVYAGTFDPRKGGAAAAAAAEYLPENYHVHICGFGSAADTESLRQVVEHTAAVSKARITYDGLKQGDDYIRFIQQCHIGLSTQDPAAAFNATSFPSKILSYMANGLSVVSIDIPAIHQSAVGEHITYYAHQTPQEIAAAIERADLDSDNRALISQLADDFVESLPTVFGQTDTPAREGKENASPQPTSLT